MSGSRRVSIAAACALGVVLVLGLVGCTTTPAPICPRVAVLDQASSLTRFRPGSAGAPEDAVFKAEITRVDTDCKYSGSANSELEANLRIYITAERGPALRGDSVDAEYFVVITDRSGVVLAKRSFPITIDFGNLQAVNLVEGTWQFFRLHRGGGAGYEIWTGWQLSESELQYNRQAAR